VWCGGAAGCKPKVSDGQCDRLVERYAQLVVVENFPDASADRLRIEQAHEKKEARADDVFKNCSTQVSETEFDCAMRAMTAGALQKCLE
jgi:hypothetical protein